MTHQQLVEYRDVAFFRRATRRMLRELVADGHMRQVDRGGNPRYTITPDGEGLVAGGRAVRNIQWLTSDTMGFWAF